MFGQPGVEPNVKSATGSVGPGITIDPGRFARDQRRVQGTLAPATLPRLTQQLSDTRGAIDYRVSGYLTDKGQPALGLEIFGEIGLSCQRCLGPLRFALQIRRDIVLSSDVDEFEQASGEDEAFDAIPRVERLDLRQLIEEEILLSLPIAASHPDAACQGRVQMQLPPSERTSPFEVLAKLKH